MRSRNEQYGKRTLKESRFFFLFKYIPGNIDKRSVQKAGGNKYHIAGNSNGNKGRRIMGSKEGSPGKQNRIKQLGNQSRTIVPKP